MGRSEDVRLRPQGRAEKVLAAPSDSRIDTARSAAAIASSWCPRPLCALAMPLKAYATLGPDGPLVLS